MKQTTKDFFKFMGYMGICMLLIIGVNLVAGGSHHRRAPFAFIHWFGMTASSGIGIRPARTDTDLLGFGHINLNTVAGC